MILYSAANCFPASVETVENPELRKKKIAVCIKNIQDQHAVLSANYTAMLSGVKAGMTVWEARLACPELITVLPHFDLYLRYSSVMKAIYEQYCSKIETNGKDACWIELPFCEKDSLIAANEIREKVKEQTGLTVSVGVSFCKSMAKLACDMKKPDTVTVFSTRNYRQKSRELPVSDLMCVDAAVTAKLRKIGVTTVGQLADMPDRIVYDLLGKDGYMLQSFARGTGNIQDRQTFSDSGSKTNRYGAACICDLKDDYAVWIILLELAQKLSRRLIASEVRAASVSVCLKDSNLKRHTFSTTLKSPTQNALLIARTGFNAFKAYYDWKRHVRAVTISVSICPNDTPGQIGIFGDNVFYEKRSKVDAAAEAVRKRFGRNSIRPCALLYHNVRILPEM